MKGTNRAAVRNVISQYNPDHDMGPDAPVTWREERLARAILDLEEQIEALEAKVSNILDALPSARRENLGTRFTISGGEVIEVDDGQNQSNQSNEIPF